MVSASALVGLVVIVAVNAVVAAVVVRFCRYQLATRVGAAAFAVAIVPVAYVATTLLFGGVLGLGEGLFGDTFTLLVFTWGLPFALGVAVDLFWMPPPDEVELPAAADQE